MRKAIGRTFLTGVLTVVPVVATLYLVVWLAATAETFLGGLLKGVLSEHLYFYGMGMLAGVGVIFAVGLLMQTWAVRRLFELGERLLLRMPLVKTVYGAVRDFFGLFSSESRTAAGQVVAVEVPGTELRLVGFLMREDLSGLPAELHENGRVAVYLPMSYQVGGYTVLVPGSAVTPVPWSREEAMRFILTAGLSGASADGGAQQPLGGSVG
jgi:uncharacterized membrane protein